MDLDSLIFQFSDTGLSFWGPFFILLMCGLGLPLPEDIVLVTAGLLAAEEHRSVWPVIVLMYVGILLGDFITFCVGRYAGRRALNSRWGKTFIRAERLRRAEELFFHYGAWVVFVGRFLPGLRAPLFFSAGILGFSRLKFVVIDGFAALISAPLFVWLGHWAWSVYEEDMGHLERVIGKTQLYIIVGVIILVALGFSWFRFLRSKEKGVQQ